MEKKHQTSFWDWLQVRTREAGGNGKMELVRDRTMVDFLRHSRGMIEMILIGYVP